jgi:hypothetical protein
MKAQADVMRAQADVQISQNDIQRASIEATMPQMPQTRAAGGTRHDHGSHAWNPSKHLIV